MPSYHHAAQLGLDWSACVWPVRSRGVRTGDYWLGMVGNDGSTVGVAIVSGLGSRYELYIGGFDFYKT